MQSTSGKLSTSDESDYLPLSKHVRVLFEEDDHYKRIKKSNDKQKENVIENDDKCINRKKELAHADFIERLILEASSNKQRRRSSNSSNNNTYQFDKLLEDENNDWFFEKILEKFENIRSKNSNRYTRSSSNDSDNNVGYGVERIIERRYYVKKPISVPKRDQLTSTSDLTVYGKKNRQLSGVSSATVATTCSCTSSTPTYVENLRDQSDSLRNEIGELKSEIEQLQTSQQQFFQQFQTFFQSKTVPSNFAPPAISPLRSPSEKNATSIPLTTNTRTRSVSTESDTSSEEVTTSGKSTPTQQTAVRVVAAPSSASVPSARPISEFMATKNLSIAPTPPVNTNVNSKPPSVVQRTLMTEFTPPRNSITVLGPPTFVSTGHTGSKPSSIAPTPPVAIPVGPIGSKPSSIAPTPPVSIPIGPIGSKPSSIAPTPPVAIPVGPVASKPSSIAPTPSVAVQVGPASSKPSSIAPTPPVTVPVRPASSRSSSVASTPSIDAPPMPSARIPTYENELAHRRVLSPRSQIVASSASIQDSSDSSSESDDPEFVRPNPPKNSKVPVATLRDNDMQDLARYSSQLELSGFPPSINPIIANPNTSSTFWDSVDQYVDNARRTNIQTGLPLISRSNHGNRFGLNNSTTKQLDKYDLEIKPQGFIESSAPFLMPPLDILP